MPLNYSVKWRTRIFIVKIELQNITIIGLPPICRVYVLEFYESFWFWYQKSFMIHRAVADRNTQWDWCNTVSRQICSVSRRQHRVGLWGSRPGRLRQRDYALATPSRPPWQPARHPSDDDVWRRARYSARIADPAALLCGTVLDRSAAWMTAESPAEDALDRPYWLMPRYPLNLSSIKQIPKRDRGISFSKFCNLNVRFH